MMSSHSTKHVRQFALFGFAILSLLWITQRVWAQSPAWDTQVGDTVYSVATAADLSIQVVGSRNNRVVALGADGATLWEFPTQGTVWGVAVTEDGSRIAVAAEDRRVYLLDKAGQSVWEFRGSNIFLDVAIARDGSLVVAVADNRDVIALDGAGGQELWRFPLPNIADTVAIYGTENARVLVGTRNSQVHLLNTDGTELWRAQLSNAVNGVDTVRNGARVVVGTETGTVALLNGANTDLIWQVQLPDRVHEVAITADGSLIAAGLQTGEVYVLAGADGATQQIIPGEAAIEALAITPDGKAVLWGDRNGQAHLVDRVAAAGAFAARQRLRTSIQIGAPLVVLALLAGFVLWVRQTAAGHHFWDVRAAKPRRLGRQVWRARVSYFFLIPTLTLLLIFNYYPAFSGLYHAFTVWKPGVETRWVGLLQFEHILRDAYFWVGIKNAAILILTGYAKTFTMPLLVAELIFAIRNRYVQYGIRSLFVIPLVVPGVVGILLWTNIYDPNIGLLNQTLQALGLEQWTRIWLGDERTALGSIIAIGFPWVNAFALLIFYGGLISIPVELFDAAKVDGAGVWRRFWNLDLPLLLPQLKLLLILGFIGGVQEFQSIFITTGGGPGNVTYTPALELYYQAVRFNNFGLASAIGTVLFVVILLGTVFYMRYVTSAIEYEA